MAHTLAKSLIAKEVIKLISNKHKTSLNEATDMFYSSPVSKMLSDDETGLYGESPLYVFSLFENSK